MLASTAEWSTVKRSVTLCGSMVSATRWPPARADLLLDKPPVEAAISLASTPCRRPARVARARLRKLGTRRGTGIPPVIAEVALDLADDGRHSEAGDAQHPAAHRVLLPCPGPLYRTARAVRRRLWGAAEGL